jgi:hypothetical protein
VAKKIEGIVGQRFGRLVVKELAAPNRHGQAQVLCECDCGTSKVVDQNATRRGDISSCGCLRRESGKLRGQLQARHGMRNTPEYSAWISMKMRVYNRKGRAWKDYGGRGIVVCDRWLESFENFFADMGFRPDPSLSLERKDNDGNYEPGNCVWAARTKQQRNQRRSVYLTARNETLHANEWSARTGIPGWKIRRRIGYGWDPERILSTP